MILKTKDGLLGASECPKCLYLVLQSDMVYSNGVAVTCSFCEREDRIAAARRCVEANLPKARVFKHREVRNVLLSYLVDEGECSTDDLLETSQWLVNGDNGTVILQWGWGRRCETCRETLKSFCDRCDGEDKTNDAKSK